MKNEKPEKELSLSDKIWLTVISICIILFAFFVYYRFNLTLN